MVRSLVLVSGFSYGGDPRMRLQFDLWLHLARTDKIALGKLLLVSGLSRDFLSAFDESTIDGIIQSFVAMSDWPLIEQNIRVDLAVDVREQARKIKAPTLSITGKYDQIVPSFYTQELADLIHTAKRAEIPSGHLSFLEKPVDLVSAMLPFLLERHPIKGVGARTDPVLMKITKERKLITFINVFNVDPEKQQQLVNLLIRATESSVRHVPGFISATLHRSLDGAKVAMYAQWRSIEDYQAMRANATALPFMQQALALAKFDPGMYEVIEIFEPLPKDS